MNVYLQCRKCEDDYLVRKEGGEDVKEPEYVYDASYDFDNVRTYRCTGCGHLLTVEVA